MVDVFTSQIHSEGSVWLGFPSALVWTCSRQMISQRRCEESGNKHSQTWPRCYVRIENIRAEKASYLQRLQRPRAGASRKTLTVAKMQRNKICWPWCRPPAIILCAVTPRIIYVKWRWCKSSSARGPWILGNSEVCLFLAGRETLPLESTLLTDRSPPRALSPAGMDLRVVCTPEHRFLLYHYNYTLCEYPYHKKLSLFERSQWCYSARVQ